MATASKQEKVWWLFGSEGIVVRIVSCLADACRLDEIGCYFLSGPVRPAYDVCNKRLINGTYVSHFLQPSARNR